MTGSLCHLSTLENSLLFSVSYHLPPSLPPCFPSCLALLSSYRLSVIPSFHPFLHPLLPASFPSHSSLHILSSSRQCLLLKSELSLSVESYRDCFSMDISLSSTCTLFSRGATNYILSTETVATREVSSLAIGVSVGSLV